jgi:hypothetical protein
VLRGASAADAETVSDNPAEARSRVIEAGVRGIEDGGFVRADGEITAARAPVLDNAVAVHDAVVPGIWDAGGNGSGSRSRSRSSSAVRLVSFKNVL